MRKVKQQRSLKVGYRNHARKYHCYCKLPWLNISGVWLADAGFWIGDSVDITVKKGKLIIENRGSADGNPGH